MEALDFFFSPSLLILKKNATLLDTCWFLSSVIIFFYFQGNNAPLEDYQKCMKDFPDECIEKSSSSVCQFLIKQISM